MAKSLPEHLNVPWLPHEAVVAFLMTWLVIPIALILGLRELANHFAFAYSWGQALAQSNITADFIFTLISGALSFATLVYFLRKYKVSWSKLGWRKFNLGRAALYLAITIGLFLIAIPVIFALVQLLDPSFNANQVQTNDFTSPTTNSAWYVSFLALVIVPPIIEETVFRGFVFPAFAKRWGVVIGAVLTSLLFGFAHLQGNVSVYTFVLSLILCFMYVRLRSIFPGMALHMINNYIAFMAVVHK
jgi:membrane protease YdiL (CAAX protease family)